MKHHHPRHVLVYRLSALGDVAMTIPPIYSCAKTWPHVTFHIVTSAFCTQLFINAPANTVMHPVEKGTSTWQLLKQLNQLPVDAVADLHNVLRSWTVDAWFLLKCKKVRMMNKMRNERKAILRRKQHTTRPITLRYFDVFERLGLPCEPCFDSVFSALPPLPIDMEKGSERWIGIAPFARYDTKTYPLDKMQEVVRLLAARSGCRLFLFGSRGEQADTLVRWQHLSPTNIHNVAGRFSLKEELALMAHLDTMISMDSANMHMASLVRTRVISIWGSTTPSCGFMGWGQRVEDTMFLGLSCQPCSIGGTNDCQHNSFECMKRLPPEVVVECSPPHSKLYIIKPNYFMCSYILKPLENRSDIVLVNYKKKRTHGIGKLCRLLRAYFVHRRGLWTSKILSEELQESVTSITSHDKVLFFGMENLKDLRILEQELAARKKSLFLWNTVQSRYKGWLQIIDFRNFIKTTRMTVSTFDPSDAHSYSINILPQVYRYPSAKILASVPPITTDVFFVGKDKNRSGQLIRFAQLLEMSCTTFDFYIVKDQSSKFHPLLSNFYHDEQLSYHVTLQKMLQSRCLLEITQKGQQGLTLRALEALFLGKKLITNNESIRLADFYNSANILVVGENTSPTEIRQFLSCKAIDIEKKITDRYDIENWIKKFRHTPVMKAQKIY